MCTALTYLTRDFYFGRTLDHVRSYAEEVTLTPRNFSLAFREAEPLPRHHAILGMAYVADGYPLYYDAVNEKGLAMAGLNFVGYTHYAPSGSGKTDIAQFELIPWVLGQCASVREARSLLETTNITGIAFREDLPPAQLHWLIADREEAITLESLREGIRIYTNPVGVLTNNPPFDQQLLQLSNYMHLTPGPPENRFSPKLPLHPYSYGMGAMGLPGDLSSPSRFVRAAFMKLNSISDPSEADSVSQFFHILGTVEQPRGCCRINPEEYEYTLYTSCCNATRGIYYYTTYGNRQINAVNMHREDLNGRQLLRHSLRLQEQDYFLNQY